MLVIINKTMGEPLWGDILLWIENVLYILKPGFDNETPNKYIYTTYTLKKGLQRKLIY